MSRAERAHPLGAILLLASASMLVLGLLWDVSWDSSVGQHSAWSPPHLATNLGGLLCACVAVWLAGRATGSGRGAALAFGLRAPLGAALVLWGALGMLGADLLERWWSRSYGLEAAASSPPQAMLTASVAVLLSGALLLVASERGRSVSARPDGQPDAQDEARLFSAWLLPWAGALLLLFAGVARLQWNLPNLQRSAEFYTEAAALYPLLLAWIALASGARRAATASALLYTLTLCALLWLFPLVPARPLIGPIHQQITHLLPPSFPLLLVVPALGFDLLRARSPGSDRWLALLLGLAFTGLFLAVQWPFSGFLLSPGADGWLFAGGGRHWPFYFDIGPERTQFWQLDVDPLTARSLALALLLGCVSARVGLWLGRASARLQR